MTYITEDCLAGAQILTDAADAIALAAELAMLAYGRDEPTEVVAALLAAAWYRHKEIAPGRPDLFARMLRDLADSAEATAKLN